MREWEVQKRIVRELEGRGFLLCHVPNGGSRSLRESRRLKDMGVRSGVPDLLVFAGPGPCPMALEVKADRGKASESQRIWLDWLGHCGWTVGVVRSVEDVLGMIGGDHA